MFHLRTHAPQSLWFDSIFQVIKEEPTERLLLSDSQKSPDVIDLTNSSPIRAIKQEPEDCRVPANDGQGQQKEPEVIDLTCDDSD